MLGKMPDITERATAGVPPFRMKLEKHDNGWDVIIDGPGNTGNNSIGTFSTRPEAEQAAYAKVREDLKKDEKEFPRTVTWTTTKAILTPEKPTQVVNLSAWKKLMEFFPTLMGIIAVISSILISQTAKTLSPVSPGDNAEIRKALKLLADSKQEMEALKLEIRNYPQNPQNSSSFGEAAGLKHDVEQLQERMASLETALGDNLDRRLAVPLMRKDLDAIKEQYRVDLAAVDARLSLVVDLMKWFLGILGLGGILTGLSNWFTRTSPGNESATSTTGTALKS
jgi:hypothetical protein